jgi:hypothetical protein
MDAHGMVCRLVSILSCAFGGVGLASPSAIMKPAVRDTSSFYLSETPRDLETSKGDVAVVSSDLAGSGFTVMRA